MPSRGKIRSFSLGWIYIWLNIYNDFSFGWIYIYLTENKTVGLWWRHISVELLCIPKLLVHSLESHEPRSAIGTRGEILILLKSMAKFVDPGFHPCSFSCSNVAIDIGITIVWVYRSTYYRLIIHTALKNCSKEWV